MIIRTLANFIFDITEPENGQTTGATLFLTNKISFFRAALVQNILARETFLIIEKKSFLNRFYSPSLKLKLSSLLNYQSDRNPKWRLNIHPFFSN